VSVEFVATMKQPCSKITMSMKKLEQYTKIFTVKLSM